MSTRHAITTQATTRRTTTTRVIATGLAVSAVVTGLTLTDAPRAHGFEVIGWGPSLTAQNEARAMAIAESEHGFQVTCEAGNFRGTVVGEITGYRPSRHIGVLGYRIEKLNGQQGGNKANVNLHANSDKKSGDDLIQDGGWHDIRLVEFAGPADVEIIFDKSGSDPRCSRII